MRKAFPEALVDVPEGFSEGIQGIHAKDRHVVAAAVVAHANAIVTLNDRDFPKDKVESFGVLLQTPNSFLVHQYHLNPDVILEKLDAQAAAVRRERSALAELLRPVAPEFADLIGAKS
jgi:hypothetical protein